MIDQIYAKRPDRVDPRMDGPYGPEQAILDVRLQNEDASRLTVLFPPWHGGGKYIEKLTDRLAANGSAVLDFDFHDRVLEPNVERVVQSYQYIQEAATERIERLIQQRGYEKTRLIGMSLGNVALAMVASRLSDFRETTIVTGSSNLALSLWPGIRTQGIRQGLESQGVTAEELDMAWRPIAPMTHVAAFQGKEVRVHIATKDEVVPTQYQKEFLAKLNAGGAKTTSRHLRTGHYAAAAMFYYFGK